MNSCNSIHIFSHKSIYEDTADDKKETGDYAFGHKTGRIALSEHFSQRLNHYDYFPSVLYSENWPEQIFQCEYLNYSIEMYIIY